MRSTWHQPCAGLALTGSDCRLRRTTLSLKRGWSVSSAVLRGRSGSAIVEEGERFDAGVIVVGSRGRGRLQAAALGSVSAEVVDHAGLAKRVCRMRPIGVIKG